MAEGMFFFFLLQNLLWKLLKLIKSPSNVCLHAIMNVSRLVVRAEKEALWPGLKELQLAYGESRVSR